MLPAATYFRVRILAGVPVVLSRLQHSFRQSQSHARSRDTATRPGGTRRAGAAMPMVAGTVAGLSFFKWLSGRDEEKVEEQTPEQQIIWTLKRAKLNIMKGHLEKAEELLHSAAHLARNENHENALIYTYDLMANLAMQRGYFEQAEKLFKATMTLYLGHGSKQDDDAMIEMSLKLASIYASQEKHEMAVSGYEWCMQTAGEKVAKQNAHILGSSPAEEERDMFVNTQLLFGMCLDSYARYHMSQGRWAKASTLYRQALATCSAAQGDTHPQTVLLMSDLAATLDAQGLWEEAAELAKRAIDLARDTEHQHEASMVSNLAGILMHQGKYEHAKQLYLEALALSQKRGEAEVTLQAEEGLAELRQRTHNR
uniref:tetratricopeptide repeat protein 19, mitochondrial isoform X2 n=1 Tax=Myxine glutinosa TaxID=7769 RepID=UPI00358E08A4